MKNLDQWILVIIACVAVVAPCITTYLNNRHQYKILKFNNTHKTKERYIEEYFESINKYIQHGSLFSKHRVSYLTTMQRLYSFANHSSRKILQDIDSILLNSDSWNSLPTLNKQINPKLTELSKNLYKSLD